MTIKFTAIIFHLLNKLAISKPPSYKNIMLLFYCRSKFSPMDLKVSCVDLMCKLIKRTGIRISFLESKVECVRQPRPPLIKIPSQSRSFDDDDDIVSFKHGSEFPQDKFTLDKFQKIGIK